MMLCLFLSCALLVIMRQGTAWHNIIYHFLPLELNSSLLLYHLLPRVKMLIWSLSLFCLPDVYLLYSGWLFYMLHLFSLSTFLNDYCNLDLLLRSLAAFLKWSQPVVLVFCRITSSLAVFCHWVFCVVISIHQFVTFIFPSRAACFL